MLRICLIFFLLPSLVLAQDNLKAPVAVVEAASLYGPDIKETGAAFLTGEEGGRLYFLTAWHVVQESPEEVILILRSGQQMEGRTERQLPVLDVALLSCPRPQGYESPPSYAIEASAPQRFQAVVVVGHPDGNRWDVNVRSSVKEPEIHFDPRFFSLNPEGIRPGSSGSPVLTEDRRLLGMVQEEGAVMAKALSGATLRRILAGWDAPDNLLVGVPEQLDPGGLSDQEIQYRLLLQEAGYAYRNGAWTQARKAYQKALSLRPSQELRDRLRDCQAEISRDSLYLELLDQGSLSRDPEEALRFFRQARAQRDTRQIRDLIERQEARIERLAQVPATPSRPGGQTYTDPLAGTMVYIEGGRFTMGSEEFDDEKPPHPVQVPSFYLGAYEVTQAQWQAIMGSNPSSFDDCDRCPVESVSWEDVQTFLQKLNARSEYTYRLPTEAEWEYAAGGGATNRTKWAGTDEESQLSNVAWYFSNCDLEPHPVGQKKPNALGLYDLSGNVWEWCQDWYHDSYEGAPKDGSAWERPKGSRRVLRGGGWGNGPRYLRVAYRVDYSPGGRNSYIGFRLARTP